MLTSSIVLLMVVNTVAASAAPFVALLSSALETDHRVATTDVPKVQPGCPAAAFRTRRWNRRRSMTGAEPKERFLWLSVRRPAGESATTMTSPTAN